MVARERSPNRLHTFRHAFRGIGTMIRTEPNAQIHALATVGVVAAGLVVGLSRGEWLAIVLTIAAVWSLEAVNTAIEAVCDLVSPEHDERVARAKDVAAGGVLIAAIAAVCVAALVFGSRLLVWLAAHGADGSGGAVG